MRLVTVYEMQRDPKTQRITVRVEKCVGIFHCWGLEIDDAQSDYGSSCASGTVGIVELEDGTIETPTPYLMKFNTPLDQGDFIDGTQS